ncbi:hypothetical protein ACFM35_01800 [Microbacterium sp. P01]|uniref:hypothetical protein n=1 Tax=Microbacterium sp. P01 TaxID=3366261 RepID=UPI0036720254
MVDARLPAEWLGSIQIDDLSDRAFRILAGALMWRNGQGTDGFVPARYTRYLHPDGDDQAAFDELEKSGFWTRGEDGYQMVGWSQELRQSTAAEVERYRESSRLRQKAYRERRKSAPASAADRPARTPDVTPDSTTNVMRDVTANVGSSSLTKPGKKSAYVERDVTRNADSPFSHKQPSGTVEPRGACARARLASEARQNTIPGLGCDGAIDGHEVVVDGTCAVCAYRPDHSSA